MTLTKEENEKIRQMYGRMGQRLLKQAYLYLRDVPLAQEALQETFLLACENSRKLLSSQSPEGWLMNTLKNVCKMIGRKIDGEEKRAEKWEQNKDGESEMPEEDLDLLYSDLCDTEEWKLVKRIAVQQATVQEVARELGISTKTCQKRYERARKKLRKRLRGEI